MKGRRPQFARQARRPSPRWAFAATLLLAGCGPADLPAARWAIAPAASSAPAGSPAPLSAAPVPAGGATLRLRLESPWPEAVRSLQLVTAGSRAKVTIAGPDLATARSYDVELGSSVALTDVPTGKLRVVTLQGLDDAGAPVAGAVLRAVGALTSGSNTLTLDAAGTAAGDVALAVISRDRTLSTHAADQLDLTTLSARVAAFTRELKLASPRLLNAEALATDVHAANGALPSASKAAYALAPGQIVVRPSDVPPGVPLLAWVNDPLSRAVTSRDGAPVALTGIAPGSWTLTLQPDAPGWLPQTRTVTVTAGSSQEAAASFSSAQAATALPLALAPAFAGLAGGELYALGGATYDPTNGWQASLATLRFRASDGWTTRGAQLATPLFAAASAEIGGQLYAFGGTDDRFGVLGSGLRYTPASDSLGALPSLPGGRVVMGAAAGAVGNVVYLAGGIVDPQANPFVGTLGFDTQSNAWLPGPFPSLPVSRLYMASAVVDGRWYVFGGSVMEKTYTGGDLPSLLTPQKTVHGFTPGAPGQWKALAPMPTARSGARTVVVNGKVWVIGGSEKLGAPSRAVEVYDPATDTWSIRAPLKSGRAFPICGLVGNQVVVAGGLRGDEPLASLPVADVEVLTP